MAPDLEGFYHTVALSHPYEMACKIGALLLFLASLLAIGHTQDFSLICQKQNEGKSWFGCLGSDFPETAMATYIECMKEQNDMDMMSFLALVCKEKSELDKWVACQKRKFGSGEATLEEDDKKAIKEVEDCVRAL